MSQDFEDEELQELLRRRAAEEQKRLAEEEVRRKQLQQQKEAVLRTIMTQEARLRLKNIELVKPELAEALKDQLIALAQSGRIPVPITDEMLKQILEQITGTQRRDFKITIRERGWK
ncbi:MAG: DNA-binding protein [Thermoprotei archaeon]